MPRKKKSTPEEPKTSPEVPISESTAPESIAKQNFRRLIEEYKEQNPVKYAQKEKALLKKLNSL